MAYTTIASTDTDVDSPITVALMTALANNPTAIANGDTGAPKIKEAAMDAASVNSAALKTSAGAVSTTGILHSTLPGGSFGFWIEMKRSSTTTWYADAAPALSYLQGGSVASLRSIPATYTNTITLATVGGTIYAQQTYVQASPPNWINKDDGEIPLFVYAKINKSTSEIVGVYSADAAPWHYNGPTDIRPQKIVTLEDGSVKKYRERKDMSAVPFTFEQAKVDPVKMAEYAAAFEVAPIVYEEITQEVKNKDMTLIPRPFNGDDSHEIILLNPVGDFMWNLSEMTKHEQFDINELLHSGYFKVNNTAMNITTPPGVQAFDFMWK